MTFEEREKFLDKISDVAGEQAKAWIFISIVEDEQGEEAVSWQYDAVLCGGRVTALGLLKHVETKIAKQISSEE